MRHLHYRFNFLKIVSSPNRKIKGVFALPLNPFSLRSFSTSLMPYFLLNLDKFYMTVSSPTNHENYGWQECHSRAGGNPVFFMKILNSLIPGFLLPQE